MSFSRMLVSLLGMILFIFNPIKIVYVTVNVRVSVYIQMGQKRIDLYWYFTKLAIQIVSVLHQVIPQRARVCKVDASICTTCCTGVPTQQMSSSDHSHLKLHGCNLGSFGPGVKKCRQFAVWQSASPTTPI